MVETSKPWTSRGVVGGVLASIGGLVAFGVQMASIWGKPFSPSDVEAIQNGTGAVVEAGTAIADTIASCGSLNPVCAVTVGTLAMKLVPPAFAALMGAVSAFGRWKATTRIAL